MVEIKIDLENDKEFISKIKGMVVEWIRSVLHNEEGTIDLMARAINQSLSWKHSNIEQFTRTTIVELIGSAVDDKSTLPNEKKAENVIIRLLREEIANFVAEKFKNVTISGLDG